jgi:hypothetical protein
MVLQQFGTTFQQLRPQDLTQVATTQFAARQMPGTIAQPLNVSLNNPYFVALMMMLWLVASRKFFNEVEEDERVQRMFKKPLVRVIIVFCAIFVACRHIPAACILTFVFFLLFRVLLNPKCRYHILDMI